MTSLDHQDCLKHLLLDMVSTTQRVGQARIDPLSEQDWQIMCDMARQHRLGPILHHHLRTRGKNWIIPRNVREQWANAFRRSAMRALGIRQSLLMLDRALQAATIPYVALKGAWLIQKAYPHPALRPMRDIDILVAPEHALQVFAMLECEGFALPSRYPRPDEHSVKNSKHLPPLRDTRTGISVEVHTRLIEQGDTAKIALNDTKTLLARAIRHEGVNFLPPTETLLHLVVHAIYDHRLDNGPLSLNDIAQLITSSRIDWDWYWQKAKAAHWSTGSTLLFALIENYHQCDIPRPHSKARQPSAAARESAKLLMLQSFDHRGHVAFRADLSSADGWKARMSLLWQRALPSRHALATFAGSPDASHSVYLHYPQWLWVRTRQRLFAEQSGPIAADAKRAAVVSNWLKTE